MCYGRITFAISDSAERTIRSRSNSPPAELSFADTPFTPVSPRMAKSTTFLRSFPLLLAILSFGASAEAQFPISLPPPPPQTSAQRTGAQQARSAAAPAPLEYHRTLQGHRARRQRLVDRPGPPARPATRRNPRVASFPSSTPWWPTSPTCRCCFWRTTRSCSASHWTA